ncbi:MAG TPA: hypothetical protein VIR63_04205, partial [Pontiella sp.]
VGMHEEAKLIFDHEVEVDKISINENRIRAINYEAHYDLAGVYSFRGEKDKAFEYLKQVESKYSFPLWFVSLIKTDPLLDNIRDDPRFKAFQQQAEEKYQAEHERVKAWLKEQGML